MMGIDSTLRNMAFVFAILQDDFEKGILEKEYTDVFVTINGDEYFMEAKSVFKKDSIKRANAFDLGQALAQINVRADKESFGVIVTNQEFEDHNKDILPSMNFNQINKINLKTFFKSKGFKNKINGYKINNKEKQEARKKRLEKYFILIINGKDDEKIREKIGSYLIKLLNKNNIKHETYRVYSIINVADKILDTIADEKNQELKYESFKNWFKIRKSHSHESLEFDENTKILFETEEDMKNAIKDTENKSSLISLSEANYQVIYTSSVEEFSDYVNKLNNYENEAINNLKLNRLIVEKERNL